MHLCRRVVDERCAQVYAEILDSLGAKSVQQISISAVDDVITDAALQTILDTQMNDALATGELSSLCPF